MTLFLNGKKPNLMSEDVKRVMSNQEVLECVKAMTLEGKSACAAVGVMMLSKAGYSPKEITDFLSNDTFKG